MRRIHRWPIAAVSWAFACVCAVAGQEESREIPRDPRAALEPIFEFSLGAAGVLRHAQFDGEVRRLDATGKEVARAKLPRSRGIEGSTTLVLSADLSRALVVHSASDAQFTAKHRVLVLQVETLKTLSEFPLGKCSSYPFANALPAVAARVTMLCYHSRPPDQPRRKPTLALVTVDTNRGAVIRWSELGGQRHGTWLGPMFFGWTYDVSPVVVGERDSCDSTERTKPESPASVIVLNRDSDETRGDVWMLSPESLEAPQRVSLLSGHPRSATVCTSADGRRLLQVTVDVRTTKQIQADRGQPPASSLKVEIIDLQAVAGRRPGAVIPVPGT